MPVSWQQITLSLQTHNSKELHKWHITIAHRLQSHHRPSNINHSFMTVLSFIPSDIQNDKTEECTISLSFTGLMTDKAAMMIMMNYGHICLKKKRNFIFTSDCSVTSVYWACTMLKQVLLLVNSTVPNTRREKIYLYLIVFAVQPAFRNSRTLCVSIRACIMWTFINVHYGNAGSTFQQSKCYKYKLF